MRGKSDVRKNHNKTDNGFCRYPFFITEHLIRAGRYLFSVNKKLQITSEESLTEKRGI